MIILEPRGLIRVLQFIFAIFAFATACSGSSHLSIKHGGDNEAVKVSWSYPYHLKDTPIVTNLNTTRETVSTSNSIKPSVEFFVFTGVTSMLLSLGILVFYILMDRPYRNNEYFPTIDWIITIIWTIFWIAGSSAWAQGVSNIRSQTSYKYITELVNTCASTTNCQEYECKLILILF